MTRRCLAIVATLALSIIAVVVLAAVVATLLPTLPILAGAVLLFGCLAALFANVMKAARPR